MLCTKTESTARIPVHRPRRRSGGRDVCLPEIQLSPSSPYRVFRGTTQEYHEPTSGQDLAPRLRAYIVKILEKGRRKLLIRRVRRKVRRYEGFGRAGCGQGFNGPIQHRGDRLGEFPTADNAVPATCFAKTYAMSFLGIRRGSCHPLLRFREPGTLAHRSVLSAGFGSFFSLGWLADRVGRMPVLYAGSQQPSSRQCDTPCTLVCSEKAKTPLVQNGRASKDCRMAPFDDGLLRIEGESPTRPRLKQNACGDYEWGYPHASLGTKSEDECRNGSGSIAHNVQLSQVSAGRTTAAHLAYTSTLDGQVDFTNYSLSNPGAYRGP